MFRYLLFAFVFAILLGSAGNTQAQTFNSVVIFGDSLSDSGNIAEFYGLPPGTSFTTNPDPVWAEIVARTFGASATNSLAGGTNYSWGGACTNPDGPCAFSVPTTAQQINEYLSAGSADPDTLYMIWGGTNDITAVVENNPSDPQGALDGAVAAAQAFAGQVQSLQDAGARYIVVLNLPDSGKTIAAQQAGITNPAIPGAFSQLADAYNQVLNARIGFREGGIVPINTFGLTNEIIQSPEDYGVTSIDETACVPGSNPLSPGGGLESIVCGPADEGYLSPSADDENYFFADPFHPSRIVHEGIASVVISTLKAPVQVSLGGEAGIEVARAHREAVITERTFDRGSGHPVGKWQSYLKGKAGWQELKPSSHPGGTETETQVLTMGTDYRFEDGVYMGAALSIGKHKNDIADASIDSTVVSGSIHGTFIFNVFYLSGAFNAGRASIDISRSIRIGSALRQESGSTSSMHFGPDIELGWITGTSEKYRGSLFFGLGWLNQKIEDYRESGGSSTSMNFSDFERDSLALRAGYQFRGNLGLGKTVFPYMRIAYERELIDDPVSVTAGSNTMSGRFTISGFEPPSQWVNTGGGLAFNIGSRTKAFAGYSGRFGSDSKRDHELDVGLRVSF